jgi:hypothetical protein
MVLFGITGFAAGRLQSCPREKRFLWAITALVAAGASAFCIGLTL